MKISKLGYSLLDELYYEVRRDGDAAQVKFSAADDEVAQVIRSEEELKEKIWEWEALPEELPRGVDSEMLMETMDLDPMQAACFMDWLVANRYI